MGGPAPFSRPRNRTCQRARPAAASARRAGAIQRRHGPEALPCPHCHSRCIMSTLRTLIVDDEALARSRMRALLAECRSPAAEVVAEAANGDVALKCLSATHFDLVL